jgi:hypothetical protein
MSDGAVDGLVAEYRDDCYGRRLLSRTWWELARHVCFDTRFELDVNVDADTDSTKMQLIDGGMTSTASTEQTATWKSRIYRGVPVTRLGGVPAWRAR